MLRRLGPLTFCVALLAPACKKVVEQRHATLLFRSDLHGQLETHPEVLRGGQGTRLVDAGGEARVASAVRSIRSEVGGHTLLIDGGDVLGGSRTGAPAHEDAVVTIERALGVEVVAPGEEELGRGVARMKELAAEEGAPWLAANVVDAGTGEPIFVPSVVRDVGGIRIGVVGFVDPMTTAPPGVRLAGEETLEPVITALRTVGHAEVVVLLAHVGLTRSVALAARVKGLDAILSSCTHERLEAPIDANGVLVAEAGSFGSFLGRLDIERSEGSPRRLSWHLVPILADAFAEASEVASAVNSALAPYRTELQHPVGRTPTQLDSDGVVESPALDLLADAVRAAAHAEIALVDAQRSLPPIAAGTVTEADIRSLRPDPAPLKVASLRGAQLRALVESELDRVFGQGNGARVPGVSGLSFTFREAGEPGRRIDTIRVGDLPLNDARTYEVAAPARAHESGNALLGLEGVADVHLLPFTDADALRALFASAPPTGVVVIPSGRAHARDLPPGQTSPFHARAGYGHGPRVFRVRTLEHDLPSDPAEAERVRAGARIFADTRHEAGAYVGASLSCRNCHMDGGQREGSLPLVGSEAMYPTLLRRANRLISLEERIQACFERSVNGLAPPEGSPILSALTSYLRWLSDEEPRGFEPPWRGINHLDEVALVPVEQLRPDDGRRVYLARCATCHGVDGQGLPTASEEPSSAPPPLWGPHSFNDGAGMARVYMLAGFLRHAMPLGAAGSLGDVDAQNVAAYIDSKDRPVFPRKDQDFPGSGPPADAVYYTSRYSVNPLRR